MDKNFRLNSMNVLALCGGMSNEHEVSLSSAEYLVGALKKRHNVTAVRVSKDGEWTTWDGRRCFIIPDRENGGFFVDQADGPVKMPVDVVFPMIHGQSGEDGAVQGLLEFAGIPYVGCDISASAICYDKALTKIFVQGMGVRQVEYIGCASSDLRDYMGDLIGRVEKDIGYPCFVKPARSGSSVGISHPKGRAELADALYTAARHDRKILIEKAVYGRELECAVLGNDAPEASLIGEILPEDGYYDYDSKYHSSKENTAIPEDLDGAKIREIQQAAVAVYKACGCSGLSRVDFFLEAETNRVIFNEINTFPGFTPISMYPKLWEAEGIHIETLCDLLIHFAMERSGAAAGARARSMPPNGAAMAGGIDPASRWVGNFVEAMSKKTAELGMSETVFKNPTGLYSGGQSITVCDALKMTAAASQYKDIRHTWGEKRYTLKVSGPNARTLNIKSSFFIEPSLPTSSYEFLGGKTGTIPKKNKNGYLKNFLCVAKPVNGDGTVMAAVVFDVTNSSRYTSMEQLLDLACAGEADGTSVEASACGAAMIGCGETAHTGRIMAAKNIDAKFQPASLAKTMTMMVMLDCVRNLDAPLTVAPDDIVPGDGPALYAGDVFTFRDALFLAFLSSSNIAAQAVARAVGEMISQFGVI